MRSGSGCVLLSLPSPLSLPGPSRPFPSPCSRQEELRGQLGSLGRRLAEAEAERDSAGARSQQLQKLLDESEQGDAVFWELWDSGWFVGCWSLHSEWEFGGKLRHKEGVVLPRPEDAPRDFLQNPRGKLHKSQ